MGDEERERLRDRLAASDATPLDRDELELLSDDTLAALAEEHLEAEAEAAHNRRAVRNRGAERREAHEFGAVTVRNGRTREAALQAREHHDLRPGRKRTG